MTPTSTQATELIAGKYVFSPVFDCHFRQDNTGNHDLLTPAIKLELPLDKTTNPQAQLAATARTYERKCAWWLPLLKSPMPRVFYNIHTLIEQPYYVLFLFPRTSPTKAGPVGIHCPFYLTLIPITAATPRPDVFWLTLTNRLQSLPSLIIL